MGVPALFRWLSKKYPKTIYPVVEADDGEMTVNDTKIAVPVNITTTNPNGVEFDNLYLDMNGIVHPCTHPEGRPPPETEEEMMVEIFKYTERIVNMIRPRKLLFLAIDGVAPRAKMNQQRSRRFRAVQEAKDKAEADREAQALWEAMGKTVSEEQKNKRHWDSNAITPGTPFMDLLAASLKYWIAKKMNTDPGWQNIQVILSDASVPGEGEHKIMDFIRRQRSHPSHDPNTRHVIYGLDADLIMLALATHEPYFRVLREDVFNLGKPDNACRICGQEGHYAAQCTGTPAPKEAKPDEKKPFIFLDIAILREYLEVELNVPRLSFPFDFERAIDDWVLLIFFVGNDFLPHLPSLEIREGAIDTLLKIWKQELPRMGGYMTNHGDIVLSSAQIILEGVAQREQEIFRRRRETEERQDADAKRRKMEKERGDIKAVSTGPSPALGLTAASLVPAPIHHPLPPRPDFATSANALGFGMVSQAHNPVAVAALGGSNHDVVANRAAIRMANMSAAETLKAELAGLMPVKANLHKASDSVTTEPAPTSLSTISIDGDDEEEVPGFGLHKSSDVNVSIEEIAKTSEIVMSVNDVSTDEPTDEPTDLAGSDHADKVLIGVKRSISEVDDVVEESMAELGDDADDAPEDAGVVPKALKVNADGTVDQEDTVKLWEPGYRERYYRQKFDKDPSDTEFRKQLTTFYVEGLAWVLKYYYQGAPSWQWYYPYHFAPFAQDFEEMANMDISFTEGAPFKPYEQLMGVFPAGSRKSIPVAFHPLMVDEDSPIIDFYPDTFEIDMNGKKMAWQGVALLPFIDPVRLLDAMAKYYPLLSEEEKTRNKWGKDLTFVASDHTLYPMFEALYGKKKTNEPIAIDITSSKGISGCLLPNPECIPGSTYFSPFDSKELPDIRNDHSLTAIYLFPLQRSPHRSALLPGLTKPPKVLDWQDTNPDRRANNGRGRGGGGGDRNGGRGVGRDGYNRGSQFQGAPAHYGPQSGNQNGRGSYGGYGGYGGGDRGMYNDHRSQGHATPNYAYQQQQPLRPPYHNEAQYPNAPSNSNYGYGAYNGYGAPNSRSGPPPQLPHQINGGYGGYGGYGSPSNVQRGRGNGSW